MHPRRSRGSTGEAPGGQETIREGVPDAGRLARFGLFKGHIELLIRPPVLEEHRAELGAYTRTK